MESPRALSTAGTKRAPFLGVQTSILGRRWAARLDASGEAVAAAIQQQHGVPEILARIVAGRGQTAATTTAFLGPSLRDTLPDPGRLSGMAAATRRLADAVERGERVAIFGDYDVDGACASVLLADYLSAAGLAPVIHIPDRITEGYGPNIPAIAALARGGARLLVTVDCGTTSVEALAEARRLGLDCLVLDHHQAPEALPEAVAIVNPNRQDDLSGLGTLCAAGVVFMVLVGLNRALRQDGFWSGRPAPDLLEALDLVALATVADVVPLTGLNRAFVTKGLAVMRLRRRPGLAALLDVAGTSGPPTAFHLGYLLGPRINAGGRIGDAGLGARLLRTADPAEARQVAEQLDGLNRERRDIESGAVADAEAALAGLAFLDIETTSAIVTSGHGWHPGIVGLVAARLRERYDRPAFAIAHEGGPHGTGSGRSIPGVDLGRSVRLAVERGLLVKGGGHAMAAGITIEVARIAEFEAFMQAEVGANVTAARGDAAFEFDGTLSAGAATVDLIEAIDKAGPFGSGNPEPVFAFPAHRLVKAVPVGGDHVRLTLSGPGDRRIGGVAFRAAGGPLGTAFRSADGGMFHIAGSVTLNRWGNETRAEIRVLDAAPAERG